MKRQKVKRIVFAWLLSFVFIFPYIAQSGHIFQHEYGERTCSDTGDDHNHSHAHDCNTCLICRFVLSSFIGCDFYTPDNLLTEFCMPEVIRYYAKKYDSVTHLDYLRAPPVFVNPPDTPSFIY